MEALRPLRQAPAKLSLALACAVVAPHLLYGYIWENPKRFKEKSAKAPLCILGKNAVEVMEKLVLGLKAAQLGTLLAWCEWGLLPACGASVTNGWAVVEAARSAAPARWLLSLGLLIPGQALNLGIYRAIGADGVYYGVKLGRPVPWATGFPFNLGLRHPQYVGAMLSWGGVFALLAATPETLEPLATVLLGWGCLYCATAAHEASSDADAPKDESQGG